MNAVQHAATRAGCLGILAYRLRYPNDAAPAARAGIAVAMSRYGKIFLRRLRAQVT